MYCRMLDAMLSKGQEDENGILFVCFRARPKRSAAQRRPRSSAASPGQHPAPKPAARTPVKGFIAEQVIRAGAHAADDRNLLFHALGKCVYLPLFIQAEISHQPKIRWTTLPYIRKATTS